MKPKNLRRSCKLLVEDESGLETAQIVMLVALGAFVMIVLNQWGDKLLEWCRAWVDGVMKHG